MIQLYFSYITQLHILKSIGTHPNCKALLSITGNLSALAQNSNHNKGHVTAQTSNQDIFIHLQVIRRTIG